ncbi:MAG TPA: DNA polymerase/3'-5' exonuclease PolX [Polyangiaceae bacterium]|nr:DNA polymerase/3'-5' exonuclease PolX [Polyangiaceae bacterium]
MLPGVPDLKADIVEALKELAELTTLDEGSPQAFRVRAYENAQRAVQAVSGDIAEMTEAELTKLDGIGKSTAKKIRQFIESGSIDKLDELRAEYPRSVVEMSHIPGVGPKAVKKLRAELGIESVVDLEKAIEGEKIRGLKGFGKKSEEKIAKAIERLGLDGKEQRTPIAKALPIALRLVNELEGMQGVVQARYCGSLRRFRETIGDLDIVVASEDSKPIMEWLIGLPMVSDVIVHGDTKTSVLTHKGLQIDLRVVAPNQFGAACLYFTGSKAHNIKLRQRAMDKGWLLNEYALEEAETGKVVASETEEAIYEALGLPWIPEVLREDDGEIEAAEKGNLPRAIELDELRGDLHVHTDLSGDGRSPLEDMVAAARSRGYRFLAITEHAEDIPLQGVKRDDLLAQREKVQALQKELGDELTLLHGVELNIGPEGGLDYDHEFRMLFDWCLASVHSHFDLTKEKQTKRIVAAMKDQSVNMIGHLTARTIGKRPPIELDMPTILETAEATRTGLEINSGLSRLDLSTSILRGARERDVVFVMTSDAHHVSELDRMKWGVKQALRGWVDPDKVANVWSRERFLHWTKERRGRS